MRTSKRTAAALLVWIALAMACATTVLAPPAWWAQRGVIASGAAADNYAPANLGQAKWMATQALAEMNEKLEPIDGAQFLIDDLFLSPGQSGYNAGDNYAPLNIGQLKNLSYRFYERLQAIGYTAAPVNLSHPAGYPWTPATSDDDNYAPANLGQLKNVFSFDLSPFAWEIANFGYVDVDPNADDDGDGLTNLQERQQGTDPNDYYNGQTPILSIIDGNNQSARGGLFLANALRVRVTNQGGQYLSNAPVMFQVGPDSGYLSPIDSGVTAYRVVVESDSNGVASAWLALPSSSENGISITVTAGNSPHDATLLFNASITPPSTTLDPPGETFSRYLGPHRVSLHWDPSPSFTVVTGYKIERSIDEGQSWTEVGRVSAAVLNFVDEAAPDDAVHTPYRITAIGGN